MQRDGIKYYREKESRNMSCHRMAQTIPLEFILPSSSVGWKFSHTSTLSKCQLGQSVLLLLLIRGRGFEGRLPDGLGCMTKLVELLLPASTLEGCECWVSLTLLGPPRKQ